MASDAQVLKNVPLFSLLDDEEAAVLASQVEVKQFAARERIYKIGDPGGTAYVMLSGRVRVATVDEDQQEVVIDEPANGDFFGFASMLDQTPHQSNAMALEETSCIEISRSDIAVLLERKPMAGMDLLTTLGRQFHATQELVRMRATRNPNEVIESEETAGERMADSVASFGGSWRFIITFLVVLVVYTIINVLLDKKAWDPYPFRQNEKDRVRGELDFDVNRRAEAEIQLLAQKLRAVDEKIGDADLLAEKLARVSG